MSFNEKLQYLRKENKLSQEQLADLLDVTRQSVSKWESGTTYPEMDKLITMCKIFKCSLDDLTNDEITEIKVERKSENVLSGLVKSISQIINKSVDMFKSMKIHQSIGTLIALFLLGLVLLLLRIPFEYLERGFFSIVRNIPSSQVAGFLSGSFNFIMDIIFFVLYILAFVYIYKVAYLDKYEFIVRDIKADIKPETKKEVEKVKEVKLVDNDIQKDNTLFNVLGNIVLWFLRILIAGFSIPFIFTLLVCFAMLAVVIYFMTCGIFYFGALFGLVFVVVLNIWLLETCSVFIFNRKVSFKRLLWTFIIGIAGVGFSGGLLALELSQIEYIDEPPVGATIKVMSKELDMREDLALYEWGYYYKNITFEVDESFKDKLLVEVSFYDETTDIAILEEEYLDINVYSKGDFMEAKELLETVKTVLKDKVLYNYSELYRVDVVIRSSQSNIETIRANTKKLESERRIVEETNNCVGYEETIEELEGDISDYEDRIDHLLEENENLQERIDELEAYVDRVKNIISE